VFHLTRHKYWFFLVSGIIIVPGLLALIFWHLNLGIDFTNGDTIDLRFARRGVTVAEINKVFQDAKAQDVATYAAGCPQRPHDVYHPQRQWLAAVVADGGLLR
jgi:preprotein translocase subunit SecF